MSDSRGYDEQLPWLQSVEDEDEPRGVSGRKMLAALALVLLAGAIIVGTFFWLGTREAEVAGAPELIQAPPGPYKVKPPNPGGLDIAGDSETAFETSAGQDTDAQLDTSKLPQGTTVKLPPASAEQAKTLPPNEARTPVAPEPKPSAPAQPTGAAGSVVQVGAFANRAQAERAWSLLAARFPEVAGTRKMIVPFPGGIRLRAGASSPAQAKQVCDTLKAAGENCFVAR